MPSVRPPTRRRMRALTAASLAAAATLVPALRADGVPTARRPLAVTAFQTADAPVRLIDRSAAAITTVGVDGVAVRPSGASVSRPDPGTLGQLRRAHRLGLRAELLVSNFSDRIGDFSEPLAHRLLGHPRRRAAVAAQLAADVTRRGFDGVSLDLEALHARDAAGLTALTTRIRRLLPARATLSICVGALTATPAYRANGFQLARLGAAVDRVILMTYDQHGPWEPTPGPVGALPWQRRSVRAARALVPARKIDLGIAGYGYGWRPHGVRTLSDARARRLAGSRAHFDRAAGEWTARLRDGSVLWWSDHRSYRLRLRLARQLGLHGVAVWDLQLSDPLTRT